MLRRLGSLVFGVIPRWTGRLCLYGTAATLVLVGGSILGLRYWLLPNIESYRGQIELALGNAVGQRITIGHIRADWEGLRPQVTFGDVTLFDNAGQPALALERIDNVLSWRSLLYRELRFHSLEIQQPVLAVRRAPDGALSVAGIELAKAGDGGGLADWLLRQREIVIRRAAISWIDEKLGAPELRLDQVTLRLYNDGDRHRFGLRAIAPAHLAGPLDVRGDFTGASVHRLDDWHGQLYVQVTEVDLAAWTPWVPLPVEVASGVGALRMWVESAGERVGSVIADVRLADVRARLAPELPELDLNALGGRIGWRGWSQGFEFFTQQLALDTRAGLALQPADFRLRRVYASGQRAAQGELRVNSLDLHPLAELAEQLPIDAGIRAALGRYTPRGSLYDLSAAWSGDWPPAKYELKGRFDRLELTAVDLLPGFANVAGSFEANERRGSVSLANRDVRVYLPRVFSDPMQLDELTADVNWTATDGQYEVRLSSVRFTNADLAGSLQGLYRTAGGPLGVADLTASLTRAEVARVARYLPLIVDGETRGWLAAALRAGEASEVKLRLKGSLAEFPFADGRKGVFEVTAKARGGVLEYAPNWPRVENITADVRFRGVRMEIRSPTAMIRGVRVAGVSAVIPDLSAPLEILEVSGAAEAATSEFLGFVAESPVAAMIDRFTDGIRAQGRGRLQLQLTLPLRGPDRPRVAGSFQFANNTLRVAPELPLLEQASGRIEFTDSSVQATGLTAQLFGGPASLDAHAAGGAIKVDASGRVQLENVLKGADTALLRHLGGSTDWRGNLSVRAKQADFVLESTLEGIASNLPAPLGKRAEQVMPLRIERQTDGSGQDRIDLSWGQILQAHIARRGEGTEMRVERAAIGLGTDVPLPERPGLVVRGALDGFDLDRWRTLAAEPTAVALGLPALHELDVHVRALHALGRTFTDVALKANEGQGRWQARVSARELDGDITWHPQGKGRLVARLERFILPRPEPTVSLPQAAAKKPAREYPALDVVVRDFRYRGHQVGRVELQAVPDGYDWRIERLEARNSDGSFSADGFWQWQARDPRTQLNVKLDVADIGKFLARFDYPQGIRGGAANLTGTLSWRGAPQDLDYPTLAGSIMIAASKGQFVKLEPGIGKLLSILSLQALPRRIALDFKDVFSEGFVFDDIAGAVRIREGVASTESFRITGSSARIVMSGEVDLARETQQLRVRVTPSVGDSVSTVTAILGGPVAGIGVYLAQKLLNDPLGHLVAYQYHITGTWSDPNVTKISEPASGAQAQ